MVQLLRLSWHATDAGEPLCTRPRVSVAESPQRGESGTAACGRVSSMYEYFKKIEDGTIGGVGVGVWREPLPSTEGVFPIRKSIIVVLIRST